jgi:hypothetical protein
MILFATAFREAAASPGTGDPARRLADLLDRTWPLQIAGPGEDGEDGTWFGEEDAPSASIMHRGSEPYAGAKEEAAFPRISLGAPALSVAFPVNGDAGAGDGAPGYADAFGAGFGGQVSGGYRILPALEARVSLGLLNFPAKTFDLDTPTGTQSNELSDFFLLWLSIGPRVTFFFDRPAEAWFDPASTRNIEGFTLHAGFQFGFAYHGSVDWPTPPPSWTYWDGGLTSLFEIYAGAEHRFSRLIGVFAEMAMIVFGPPNAASGDASGRNEAGSLTALRLSLGLTLSF